ncbi:MAG TPA: choice-of-anchor P family protein [Candidatus Binatia bacterium]|nr:choice-of-anchor P family protein [Candidatus Binatia bacterium]
MAISLCILGVPTAGAQTRVGGGASALTVHIDNLADVEPNPEVVLPDEGGSTEAHVVAITLPGVVATGTLTAESSGTVGLASASANSEGRVEGLNLLNGLVTADLLVAHASSTGNGVAASSSAAGSTFVNLFIAGLPIALNPPPNTVIPIPGVGAVILNEQVTGGNGTSSSSLTVNMIHVVLNGLLDGDVTVGSATSEVDVSPLSNTCACPADDNTVSGESYGAFVDVLNIDLARNPQAILSSQGGSAQGQALGLNVTTLLSTGTVTSTSTGAITPTMATSQSVTAVEQLSLLGGLIHANAVQAAATCTGNGTTASCSTAGTTLANLVVGALVLNIVPPPNTVIPLPLVGSLTLNEQIVTGNGTTTRGLTVNLLHVHLAGILGQGDIIVASAQAGVDFDPPTGCMNVCDDGNPCNGVEMCGANGCVAGPPLVCDDGNPCNGAESCSPQTGCTMGTTLVCNDGNVCNGLETCDPQTGCQPGTTLPCSDGNACNGTETCDPTNGCQTGTAPTCDDGNVCNGVETCDAQTGCAAGTPLVCNDGNACNGTETCNPQTGCQPAQGPQCDDNDPCNGVETCNGLGGCIPGTPPFMADVEFKVKDGALIEGDSGANALGGRVLFGRSNFMADGTTLFGDRVSLGNATSVFDVRANNFMVGQDVVVRGTTGPMAAPLVTPYCPVPAFAACAGSDLLIPAGGVTGPIAPGTYRNVRIPNGGTLVLGPGAYHFCSLGGGRNVTVRTTGAVTTSIEIHGVMKLGNESFLGPDAGTPRPTIRVGGHQVRLGAGTAMEALLSAPDARMSMGRASRVAGTFCVDKLNTDHSIVLQCP